MGNINVYNCAELKAAPMPEIEFRIDQIVPTSGIVFHHGPTSVGKTVLAVEEAICVSTGAPFLGLTTSKGRVAFLEIDTPEILFRRRFKPRVDELDVESQIMWVFFPVPFDCLGNKFRETETGKTLQKLQDDFNPEFVIVDTLRKVYFSDEKSGEIPSTVYGIFQMLFPNATIQFNAHDRKASRDFSAGPSREDFSGHQAWLNDAQSGLHLTKGSQPRQTHLELTKSQWSDTTAFKKMTLHLSEDGCYVDTLDQQRSTIIQATINAAKEAKPGELDQLIADRLKVSPRQARRLRTALAKASTK